MRERHARSEGGWLRAAVLGANDGIISTSGLVIGVAAAGAAQHAIVTAGLAGLVAGAMSMATGEYVSVSSQADSERADLAREREELEEDPEAEHRELAAIYVGRGLDPRLASEVARQLAAKDALAAHARDELGISDRLRARPTQAALASAGAFATGAALPLATALLASPDAVGTTVAALSLPFLAALGAVAARIGRSSVAKGAMRVTFWGAIAMALTAAAGRLFDAIQ
ncbi:MAG TPA: VIT1/CCC1 transporter family protein [Steroidobacteraceae bacterium]|nr:VIT1/CCC1 transporter family protein [Steroidobacteraceae bacterium]